MLPRLLMFIPRAGIVVSHRPTIQLDFHATAYAPHPIGLDAVGIDKRLSFQRLVALLVGAMNTRSVW